LASPFDTFPTDKTTAKVPPKVPPQEGGIGASGDIIYNPDGTRSYGGYTVDAKGNLVSGGQEYASPGGGDPTRAWGGIQFQGGQWLTEDQKAAYDKLFPGQYDWTRNEGIGPDGSAGYMMQGRDPNAFMYSEDIPVFGQGAPFQNVAEAQAYIDANGREAFDAFVEPYRAEQRAIKDQLFSQFGGAGAFQGVRGGATGWGGQLAYSQSKDAYEKAKAAYDAAYNVQPTAVTKKLRGEMEAAKSAMDASYKTNFPAPLSPYAPQGEPVKETWWTPSMATSTSTPAPEVPWWQQPGFEDKLKTDMANAWKNTQPIGQQPQGQPWGFGVPGGLAMTPPPVLNRRQATPPRLVGGPVGSGAGIGGQPWGQ